MSAGSEGLPDDKSQAIRQVMWEVSEALAQDDQEAANLILSRQSAWTEAQVVSLLEAKRYIKRDLEGPVRGHQWDIATARYAGDMLVFFGGLLSQDDRLVESR